MGPKKSRAEKNRFEQALIELVKDRPAIWMKSHKSHSDAIFVANNWSAIYKELAPTDLVSDGASCTTYWRGLWAQWLAFKNRTKGTTGAAGGRKPTFRHEDSMRFFDDPREIENMNSTYTNVESNANNNNDDLDLDENGTDQNEENTSTESPSVTAENSASPSLVVTPKSSGSLPKKQKLDPFGEQLLEIVKGKELTEFQHFCSNIAIRLEKISQVDPKSSVRLQRDINLLISDMELEVLYK